MKATYFEEPELEFSGGRHIDIRFGLSTFGALDRGHSLAPSIIRLGVVGDQESIDKFTGWVGKCRSGIDSKTTALPTLFPAFPGFGDGKPFCDAICDSQLTRSINSRDIRALATLSGRDDVIRSSVDRYISESHDLCQNAPCDVVVCLVPAELLKPIDTGAAETSGPRSRRRRERAGAHVLAWHDLLKARSMGLKVPVQMVRPATYGGKVHRYRKDGKAVREIEDEATRAWNFFTALYYKAGGVPWRLQRRATDYDACFVGISYYHEIAGENVQTSVAQVFNERGEGVDEQGFTTHQRQYLQYLAATPEQQCNVERLAIKLGCDAANVRQEIEPYLIELGLVDPTPRQGRGLTEAGLSLVANLCEVVVTDGGAQS